MELATARGTRLALTPTPEAKVPKGFRKGRGTEGVLLMCRLEFERPGKPAQVIEAPVVRLGEAHRLGHWLAGVAAGAEHPASVPGAPALRLAAPFLSLDLAALDATSATFRVHLAVPAPGGSVADVHDLLPLRLPLTVPLTAVGDAARAWAGEIPPLPPEA